MPKKKQGRESLSSVLRKTQKTLTKEKGTVKYGRRKKLLGKNPDNIYGGDSPVKTRKKK